MNMIENAISFHLNGARKALLRASGNKLDHNVVAAHAQALSTVRDETRGLIAQHRKAEETIRLIALQPAELSVEQRAALAEFANAMRVARGEAPLNAVIVQ